MRLLILFFAIACLRAEDLIILIDKSASFLAADKQRTYIPFVERLIESLPDGISVEVNEFSLKVKRIFQADALDKDSKEQFKGLLYSVKSIEGEDSALEVLNFLLAKKPKVAILFTDGVFSDLEDSKNSEELSALLKRLREVSIKLIVLSPDGFVNQDFLFEASAVTKGLSLSFSAKGAFKSVMIEILKSFSKIDLDSFIFFSVPALSLVVLDEVCQDVLLIDPDFKVTQLDQFKHLPIGQRCFIWINRLGEWGVSSKRPPVVLQSPEVLATVPSTLLAGEVAIARVWIQSLGNKIAYTELLNETKVYGKVFKEGIVGDPLIVFPLVLDQKTKIFEGELCLNDVGDYKLKIILEGPFESLAYEQKIRVKDESVKLTHPANVKEKILKELPAGSWVFLEAFKGGIFHKLQTNSDSIKTFNNVAAIKLNGVEADLFTSGELKIGKSVVRFKKTLELNKDFVFLAKEVKNNLDLLKTSLVVAPPQFVLFAIFLMVLLKGSKQKFADEFSVVINDLRTELSTLKSVVNDVQSKDVEQLMRYMREIFLKTKSLTQTGENKDQSQEEV